MPAQQPVLDLLDERDELAPRELVLRELLEPQRRVHEKARDEVGGGLLGFVRQQGAMAQGRTILTSLRHPQETQPDLMLMLQTLGRLWLTGLAVDWQGFGADERRRRVQAARTAGVPGWLGRGVGRSAVEQRPVLPDGDFQPVLAKHSKHFSLQNALSIGVDEMQRNFDGMRIQVETRLGASPSSPALRPS